MRVTGKFAERVGMHRKDDSLGTAILFSFLDKWSPPLVQARYPTKHRERLRQDMLEKYWRYKTSFYHVLELPVDCIQNTS